MSFAIIQSPMTQTNRNKQCEKYARMSDILMYKSTVGCYVWKWQLHDVTLSQIYLRSYKGKRQRRNI